MSTYKELRSKLESNHAVCEAIKKEMDAVGPDELWIAFHSDKKMYVFHTEKEAREWASTFVERVNRYVLPQPDPQPESTANL